MHTTMTRSRKVTFIAVLSAVIAATSIALGSSTFNLAHAQGKTSDSITPSQKAAMCDPKNPKLVGFVNTTESHVCGIPASTPSDAGTTTSSESPTTTSASSESETTARNQPSPSSDRGTEESTTSQ